MQLQLLLLQPAASFTLLNTAQASITKFVQRDAPHLNWVFIYLSVQFRPH